MTLNPSPEEMTQMNDSILMLVVMLCRTITSLFTDVDEQD